MNISNQTNRIVLYTCRGALQLPFHKTENGLAAPWSKLRWPAMLDLSTAIKAVVCQCLDLNVDEVTESQIIAINGEYVAQAVELCYIGDKIVNPADVDRVIRAFLQRTVTSLPISKNPLAGEGDIQSTVDAAAEEYLAKHSGKLITQPFVVQAADSDTKLAVGGRFQRKRPPSDTEKSRVRIRATIDGILLSTKKLIICERSKRKTLRFNSQVFLSTLRQLLGEGEAEIEYERSLVIGGGELLVLTGVNDVTLPDTDSTLKEE